MRLWLTRDEGGDKHDLWSGDIEPIQGRYGFYWIDENRSLIHIGEFNRMMKGIFPIIPKRTGGHIELDRIEFVKKEKL